MDKTPHWVPQTTNQLNMIQFTNFINSKLELNIKTYKQLHKFSVSNKEFFWALLADFCEIQWIKEPKQILHKKNHMIESQWFVGSQLSYAENVFKNNSNDLAIEFIKENDEIESYTYKDLYKAVAKLQQHLKSIGITKGDRVAGLLPNCPQAIIAMLATTSLGAIWTSTSPDFGTEGVVDRFGQVEAKVLFTTNAYYYNSKTHDCLEKSQRIQKRLPSLIQTIVIPFVENHQDMELDNSIPWSKALDNHANKIEYTAVDFDHPLYILYSSGTTGKPKCIVHGTGGILLQHKKELMLHSDLKSNDKLFYFTTCGWMMWNWMVSTLTTGASVLLYDGSPFYPDGNRLIDIVDQNQVTHFGTSAKWISAIEKAGIIPSHQREFKNLRTILSTGSPLMPESYDYVYQQWKKDICLSSISGGTDICSCFALGNPALPVYKGELQCLGLGMDVKILNDTGHSVFEEAGELSCLSEFPVMPVKFWNDENHQLYKSAYFDKFDNIWCHGDLAEITENGGLIIYGRSDATLNPGGVRIGTAEIYRQVDKLDEIMESIAVGQRWEGDVRVVLFVVLRNLDDFNDDLIKKIKTEIRKNTTPRHVPAKVLLVNEIPKTLSGKIVEIAVKKTIHGEEINNQEALANPESLNQYKNRIELQS